MTKTDDGKYFVQCSCNGRTNEGVPCTCFFNIADNGLMSPDELIDLSMIDVRYLKTFNSNYGDESDLGEKLYEAQAQCFKYEGLGVHVSEKFVMKLMGAPSDNYPKLCPGTTSEDYEEAYFVYSRPTTTRLDMMQFRLDKQADELDDDDLGWHDEILLKDNTEEGQQGIVLSHLAKKMQDRLNKSEEKIASSTNKQSNLLNTDSELAEMRKDAITELDKILNDERGSMEMKADFQAKYDALVRSYWETVNKRWGANGGGDGTLELCGETGALTSVKKRKQGAAG